MSRPLAKLLHHDQGLGPALREDDARADGRGRAGAERGLQQAAAVGGKRIAGHRGLSVGAVLNGKICKDRVIKIGIYRWMHATSVRRTRPVA
jgi:hypothetical protein